MQNSNKFLKSILNNFKVIVASFIAIIIIITNEHPRFMCEWAWRIVVVQIDQRYLVIRVTF